MLNLSRLVAAIAFTTALGASPGLARVELGVLDCVVEGGAGFIVGSRKRLSCTFSPADNRRDEPYFGLVKKFGLDIGRTGSGFIKWLVFAPTFDSYRPGALAGDYVGVSAEATIGVGLGANVLVGGFDRSFALQPLSVQAQEGLNLAVGFTGLELRSAE